MTNIYKISEETGVATAQIVAVLSNVYTYLPVEIKMEINRIELKQKLYFEKEYRSNLTDLESNFSDLIRKMTDEIAHGNLSHEQKKRNKTAIRELKARLDFIVAQKIAAEQSIANLETEVQDGN